MSNEEKNVENDEGITFSDIFWAIIKLAVIVYIIYAIPFLMDTIEELWYMIQYTRMGGY